MPSVIDLSGEIFGRLRVIERSENNKQNKTTWKCQCQCGNEVIVSRNELRSGDTNSCGCLRKDMRRIDISGQKFGKLMVLEIAESRGKSTCEFWKCKCDCGNEHICSSQHLRLGQVKSCGCWFEKSDEVLLEEAKERFFSNIEKTSSCWVWKGVQIKGYGVIFFKKSIKAHRFSFLIHHGELKNEMLICHKCDNPICVNPDHLYQGTPKDNHNDMVKRGRFKPRGKSQPLSCCK